MDIRRGLWQYHRQKLPWIWDGHFRREADMRQARGPESAKSLHRKNAAPRVSPLGGTHHVSVAVCKFAAVSFTRNQDSKAPT